MPAIPPFFDVQPPSQPLRALRPEPPALKSGLSLAGDPQDEADKVEQVAHDFETLLVKQIFASMRQTVAKKDGGFGEQMFTSMLDDQLASHVADAGGMGLADPLTQVLRGTVDSPTREQEDDNVG